MAHLLQDLDFSGDSLHVLLVLYLLFFEDFHCNLKRLADIEVYLFTCENVSSLLDLPECALPKRLPWIPLYQIN